MDRANKSGIYTSNKNRIDKPSIADANKADNPGRADGEKDNNLHINGRPGG